MSHPRRLLLITMTLLLASVAGCEEDDAHDRAASSEARQDETRRVPEGATITKEREVGPIRAKVSLKPQEPRFGDLIELTLEVEAAANVDVFMPPLGEALGRFSIRSFAEKTTPLEDGGQRLLQRYKLEAPSSGQQTIPELLVEFQDLRPESPSDEFQEILTEEITFSISSVLPQGEIAPTMRPARGALEPRAKGTPEAEEQAGRGALWWWILGVIVALLATLVIWKMQRRSTQRSAYEVAVEGLSSLEARGVPDAETADGWYVGLSDVIRRYLEGRFSLRAPELTTEEFLLAASDAPEIEEEHKRLLRQLLSSCDRVKFAAYVPSERESREALDAARRFVEETRIEARPETSPRAQTA